MKRTARPITAKYLQNAAAFYLERYPSTAEGLRRVLNRRVRKAEMLEAPVMDNVKQAIDAVVAKFVAAGVIDDKAFAQTKARALHRRGTSTSHPPPPGPRGGGGGGGPPPPRRRLGPYRPPQDRKDNRARDLAAMARAGFAYDVAKKVIDAPGPDALDES